MPGLKRLIIAISFVVVACPVLAQPDSVPPADTNPVGRSATILHFDTVHLFDTTVVKHTTYQLDSSSVVQKQVAELKGEFYDKALDAISREDSRLDAAFTVISILLTVIAGMAAYGGFSSHRARKAIERDRELISDLRKQAESDTSDIRDKRDEANKFSRVSAEAAMESDTGEDKTPFQDRIKLISEGDAQKSIDLYEELLFDMKAVRMSEELVPSSLRRSVGLNYHRLDRYEKAAKELKLYLKEDPTDKDALFAMAYALGELKRYDEACVFWDRVTQADLDNEIAFSNWGIDLRKLYEATKEVKSLELALEKYEKATSIKADSHVAFYNWGISLGKMYDATKKTKWLELAFEKYEKAVSIKPDMHDAFYNWGLGLGKMYDATKETKWLELACERYEKAISIKPDKHKAYYNLASALALLEKRDEMLDALGKAITFDGKYKKLAREDKDFKKYWGDDDFIKLTKEDDDGSDAEDGDEAPKEA